MLLSEIAEQQYFWRKTSIRSEETRRQYRIAFACFSRHLERPATIDDLNDDAVLRWMSALTRRELATVTVRERIGRILAMWTWLAKRGDVPAFPTVEKPQAPEPLPRALTESQLRAVFDSAAMERGLIDGIPANIYWRGLFAFLWNTGERKSAALSLRIEWLNLATGAVTIPPKFRKGGRKWGVYHLWEQTVSILERVINYAPNRELVFPWPFDNGTFYNRLTRIFKGAGIPNSRHFKTHCFRVSHATHLSILGGDATRALGHSSQATTQKHYIDATQMPPEPQRLFVPWS